MKNNILLLGLTGLLSVLIFSGLASRPETAYAADCSTTTVTVTQASFHEVVIDEPGLPTTYVSYRIDTGATDTFDDLWVRLENFSDITKLDLATNEDGLYHVGPMDVSSNEYVYFYVKASATNTAQTYDVNLFEGNPSYGTSFCTSTGTHDKVSDEIQAAANKVNSVVNTAPYIGGTMTITVSGDTGTMSSSRPEGSVFIMTPASVDAWPADCYELFDTEITFSGGNSGTYNDGLVVTGLNSPTSSYVVVYSFRATCTTASPTTVTPVNYISSGGTNLKHTDTGTTTYTAIPPVPPAENRIVMAKSVSPGGSAGGGTGTYSLTFTNTAPVAVTVDTIQDTLPSTPAVVSYTASSSQFNAVSVPEPNITGQVLTWGGAFVIPANSSVDFTYDAVIPATNGNYTNSAIAFVGSTQIDQTIDTTDNTPATVTYGVGDPNLSTSTKTVSDVNGNNVEPGDTLFYTISVINSGSLSATGVDVTDTIDTDTDTLTNVVIGANASSCGASFVDSSTSTALNVVDVDVASGGNCDITFEVTVKAGTPDNTDILNSAVISAANEGGVGGNPTSTPLSVQLVPNLTVTKTENDADNYVLASDVVTYTVTIANDGDTTGTGIDLNDTITGPVSLVNNFTFTNCGSIYSNASTLLNIQIANVDVAVGVDCVITYDVTIDAGATNGQLIDNAADVSSADGGGNDPAVVNATQLTVGTPPVPALSVTKTENDVDDTVLRGQTVAYTVTITNAGTGTGTTSFTDAIDTDYGTPLNFGYTNCGGSESSGFSDPTLTVSNLVVTTASPCVVTYDVVVSGTAANAATLANSADVAVAAEGGNDPAAVAATTLTVDAAPNLAVTKTENDADDTVTPGQTVTYTVTITNSGTITGTTSFTDAIDTDYGTPTNFGYTNCGGGESSGFSAPTLTVSTLVVTTASPCVVTYDVVVDTPLNETATLTNSADVAVAAEGGNDPAAVAATTLAVDATPNLGVTKTDDDVDNSVTPGQTVTYTVSIQNTGDGEATTSFTDTIDTDFGAPSNFTYTNCGGSESSGFSDPTLTISALTIASGATCDVTYDVVVDTPSVEGASITNSADVAIASQGGNNPTPATADTLTVDVTPTLAATKTENDADDLVSKNQTVTYTVTITNSGDGPGTTSFTDAIDTDYGTPTNFGYTNCGGSESSGFSAPTLTVSNLVVGTSSPCVVTYDVVVSGTALNLATLVNSADVATATEGGNDPTAVAATTLTVSALPNLAVTKTENDADDTVTPGQTVTYTVTITNSGDGPGTTSFTDAIDTDYGTPTNFGYTNCGGSESSGFSAPTLTVSNLVVTTSNPCVVTYDLVVDTPLNETATLVNSADVAAASEGGNNPAAVAATTLAVDATPALAATKTENDADNTVSPNQTVQYTVTITNSGNGAGTTLFTDAIDTDYGTPSNFGYTNCGGSESSGFSAPTLTVSNLVVSTSSPCVVTYDVVVSGTALNLATLTNSADVATATEGGNDPAAVAASTLTVSALPNLVVTKSENDADNIVTPGQTVTYTVAIQNTGDGVGSTSFTDTIDTDFGSPSNFGYTNCGGSESSGFSAPTLTISALSIAAGATCSVSYDVVVDSPSTEGATISNSADVATSTEGGNNPGPATATNLTVDTTPALTVTSTENDADNSIAPSQVVTYTMTISNSGDGDATGVSVTDTFSGVAASIGTYTFTNCGSSYANVSAGTTVSLTGLEIATTIDCVVTYQVTVSSGATDGQVMNNSVDASAASEGGNNPAVTSASTLTVDDGAPIASDDTATVTEESTSNTIDWDDNDTLTDNATLDSFDSVGINGGTISDNGNGTFNYVPSAGYAGSDEFDYTICDDDTPTAKCSTATVIVTINDEGSPDAVADSATTTKNIATTIDWDDNDSTVDNATLNSFDATTSQGGSVTVKNLGTFTYTPPANFSGSDSFTYTICDDDTPTATCDTATITVQVQEDLDNDGEPDTTDADDDQDGIDDTVEGDGPNGGDVNGDGTPDNTQSNVSSRPNTQNENKYVSLESGGVDCGIITNFDTVAENELAVQSDKYDFPIGLFDFTIKCTTPGDSTTITFYLDDLYDTSDWTYVKYDGGALTYDDTTIVVTYGTATVGSKTVTTMSYTATDGTAIDEDKLVNALIVDPSGPAVLSALEQTGRPVYMHYIIGSVLIVSSLLLVVRSSAHKNKQATTVQ